jgi:hypothetical protein
VSSLKICDLPSSFIATGSLIEVRVFLNNAITKSGWTPTTVRGPKQRVECFTYYFKKSSYELKLRTHFSRLLGYQTKQPKGSKIMILKRADRFLSPVSAHGDTNGEKRDRLISKPIADLFPKGHCYVC